MPASAFETGQPFLVCCAIVSNVAASMPGIVAGMSLAFAKALGEFGATISFVSNIPGETRTIALAMYTLIERPDGGDGMLRLAAVSLALAFGALLLSEWMVRRSAYRRPPE